MDTHANTPLRRKIIKTFVYCLKPRPKTFPSNILNVCDVCKYLQDLKFMNVKIASRMYDSWIAIEGTGESARAVRRLQSWRAKLANTVIHVANSSSLITVT